MQQRSRRAVLGACGAGLALGAGCLEQRSDSDGEEPDSSGGGAWMSFRGGPSNSGFVAADAPRSDPEQRWTVDVTRPRTAAIADGTVYLAGGSTLVAVDLVDGDEQWSIDLEGGASGSPAVADDAVVCPVDGALVAVDRDGDDRRRIPLDGGTASVAPMARQQSRPAIRSSPTVVDGTAYVGTSESDLVAIDLANEEVTWRTSATGGWTALSQSQERGSASGVSSPAVADGRVVVGTGAGVAAFDAADGSREWTHDTDRAVRSSPAVVDGTVYIGGSTPTALAPDSGDVEWRADDAFEALRGASNGRWHGALRRQELPSMSPSVAVADETVVVHDSDDRLLAIDRSDGSRRWETALERVESLLTAASERTSRVGSATQLASSWSSPAIAGDVVIVGTSSGIVAASLSDGDGLWRVSTGSRVTASPAVADGTVVVGDDGGTVYALAESD